jgi:hypothetical protein
VKIWIDADEWYPVFSIMEVEESYATGPFEFTDEEVARIKASHAEFQACQTLIYRREKGVG